MTTVQVPSISVNPTGLSRFFRERTDWHYTIVAFKLDEPHRFGFLRESLNRDHPSFTFFPGESGCLEFSGQHADREHPIVHFKLDEADVVGFE